MGIKTKFFGGIICAGMIFHASIAWAEITANNAYSVMSAMQDFGFVATMGEDSDGDPRISSRVSRSSFFVYFYGCTNNKECQSITIKAGYNLKGGISASRVNEWNRQKRFSRAYIDDESDPFISMDINLDFEGVGNKNFQDTLDLWRKTIETFETYIDW